MCPYVVAVREGEGGDEGEGDEGEGEREGKQERERGGPVGGEGGNIGREKFNNMRKVRMATPSVSGEDGRMSQEGRQEQCRRGSPASQ